MQVLISFLELLVACCLLLTRNVGAYCCWDKTDMYYCPSADICDSENCYKLPFSNFDLILKVCNWEGNR